MYYRPPTGTKFDTADHAAAREQARQSAATMLARPPYAASIARLGFPADQIAAVSDDLVRALVAHGDPDAIAAAAAAHRAAGADHVVLMPSAAVQRDLTTGVEQLERLAPAVVEVR